MQRPSDTLPNCTVTYQGSQLCFQGERGRNYFLGPEAQLVYEGSAISPEELEEGTKATLKLGTNNLVTNAVVTYWKRRPTALQQFNEAVVIFSVLKFPTTLLSKLFEGDFRMQARLSFLQSRFFAMRKVGGEGLHSFLTAVGLAYLEHLMLPQVPIGQLYSLYYSFKAAQTAEEDLVSAYIEALGNAKQAGSGNDALDQYSSNSSFQAALLKGLRALLLHFIQEHPENDLAAIVLATSEGGLEGYKTQLEYENDLVPHQATLALTAYVLPIRLKVYSTYEHDKMVESFPCDDSKQDIARISLLSRTNTYCVLYSKAMCQCEGFLATFEMRQKTEVGPGCVRALYYVPKKKEEIRGFALQEEQEALSGTVSKELFLSETAQKLISGFLAILDTKEVRLGVPFFTEELIMQTYEAKAAYKKQLLQLKSSIDTNTESKLTFLEKSPSFANLALMKQCSKCDKHPGVVLLAVCKHYICDGCLREYIQECLKANGRILEPDGQPMKTLVCPIRTCQTAEPLPESVLRFFLGAQFDNYVEQAERVVMTKKCRKCGTLQEQSLFYLMQTCGCKVCAYCLIELVGSHRGYCLCGQYIAQDAVLRASQHMMRCPVCNQMKSLIQEYTPVKCPEHIICRQCLEEVMDRQEKRCPIDYRVFASYEVDTARMYFTRQCMLYCQNYFNSSKGLLKLSCPCVYCEDCAKMAAKRFREYKNCYVCTAPFSPEIVAQFEMYRKVEQYMMTVKADVHISEECKVCLGPIGRVQRLTLIDCGHNFHLNCLKSHAENYIATDYKKAITCPDPRCGKDINGSIIEHHLLKAKDYAKYSEKLVRIIANVTQCPQCQMEFEFVKANEGDMEAVRCQNCNYSFCSECKLEFLANHDAKNCRHANMLSIIAGLEAGANGNPAFSVAQCPACQTPYMKDDNCDHVQCVKPGCVAFCFKCSCLRAPTLEHHNMWHRPQCPHYQKVENDDEPQRAKCPECVRLGRRCDPPKDLKTPCRFDIDEY